MATDATKAAFGRADEAQAAPPPRDALAERLRGFGPLGLLAIAVIVLVGNPGVVPVGALLVLLWAWRSRTPWREIGFVRPASWTGTLAAGIAFGIALKFLMKAIVMPLLGAEPVNQTYHYLAGNRAALPFAVYAMIVRAGFGEETVFRGFLFERLGSLLGHAAWAKAATVMITAGVFGVAHYADQGLAGMEQATFTGIAFGSVFAITGRIWTLIVAHAAFDLTAVAIIYWDVESAMAHLVFK